MDGQMSTRSGNDNSHKRPENLCEKRLRNRNRGTNNKRHKFLIGTGCIVVYSKLERQTTTSKGYWKKPDGHVRGNNYHGYSRPPFDEGLDRLRVYRVMHQ